MTEAPVAPQGPGVLTPFPAPPTEGRRIRIGWGLGIGAAVLVLVCGGGLAAVAGLVAVAGRALNEQVKVVVSDYLGDVRAKAQYTTEQAGRQPIRDFRVGSLDLASVDLAVPVDVTYTDGRAARLQAYLGQSQETGEFQVCSVEE
jgi:hypothetical protein